MKTNYLLDLVKQQGLSNALIADFEELLQLDFKIASLVQIQSLLTWDQEVLMPTEGMQDRCEHMSVIENIIHEHIVAPRVAEILHTFGVNEENTKGNEALPEQARLWLRKKYKQWYISSCTPPALLQEIVKTRVQAHCVWVQARKENNFSKFAPLLQKTINLQQEKADCIGYKESRYDALLEIFEPSITVSILEPMFLELGKKLQAPYLKAVELSKKITRLNLNVSLKEQEAFCAYLKSKINLEDNLSRSDQAPHPFFTKIGSRDLRITLRYIEDKPISSVMSLLHEAGHAFYEFQIDPIFRNTVCDEGASFGIHESQSRFLECIIGHHHQFWYYYYPEMQKYMPAFSSVSLDSFIKNLNYIEPSLIRVEADELSYNFHIIIRFELEKALIENNLSIKDLPDAWNEKYKKYLNIVPQDFKEGVLQDVHWSEGYFGYFPSYSLGNIYAATLFEILEKEMPKYQSHLSKGDLAPIQEWLKNKIHKFGASKLPNELLIPSIDSLIKYLNNRYLV